MTTAIVLLILLFLLHITCTITEDNIAALRTDDGEILFGGEYVMLGDTPDATSQDLAPSAPDKVEESSGTDLDDTPVTGEEITNVSTKHESPMTVKKPDETKKQGTKKPTAEEDAAKKAAEKKKQEEKEQSQQISNKVGNAFGGGSSSGKQGSPNGNSTTGGALTGSAGSYDLAGRTIASWGRPHSPVDGKIVIAVIVNPKGQVISATYKSGTGSAASNQSVRQSCIEASKKSKFSVATDQINNQHGTITWIFK